MNLAETLGQVMAVATEDDGALTVTHEGTVASLRTMEIAEDLEMVWLMQMLAFDVPLDDNLRERVAAAAAATTFGTVMLTERSGGRADVTLRYIFPAGGLGERALQTLVLLVLAGGVEVHQALD